jgi:hypothetical protein
VEPTVDGNALLEPTMMTAGITVAMINSIQTSILDKCLLKTCHFDCILYSDRCETGQNLDSRQGAVNNSFIGESIDSGRNQPLINES